LQRAAALLDDAAKRPLDKVEGILLVVDIEVKLAGQFQ
jgi:hypothetical protein